MLECPSNSSSGEASSSAADPAVETARANSRDMSSTRLEHSDADGKVELGLVTRKLVRTSRSTAATKGSWAENARDGPLVRHGPDKARKICPGVLSSRAVCLEPGKKPNNTSRKASRLPGGGVSGHLSSSDLRTTRPPYEPATHSGRPSARVTLQRRSDEEVGAKHREQEIKRPDKEVGHGSEVLSHRGTRIMGSCQK